MIRKAKNAVLLVVLLALQTTVYAQDEEITTEDLTAYAELMLKVDSMKVSAKNEFSEMVKSHELMDGGRRYNELKKAMGDDEKLAEIEATEEEIAAYNELSEFNSKASTEIKAAFGSLVKDGMGARKYNAVKRKLKSDEATKAEYEALYESLSADTEEADDAETN